MLLTPLQVDSMDPQEIPMVVVRDLTVTDFENVTTPVGRDISAAPEPYSEARTRRFQRVFSAARTGSFAILGQALFAGANFVANVLLARWLTPDQYGAFALAYACFLLFLMLYSACVYEPLIVFGSGRYASRFPDYFGLLIRGNTYVLATLSGLMLATSVLLSFLFPDGVQRDFMALSLAAPFVLVTWLGRGGFYAQLKPGKAAWGGAFYFFTLVVAFGLLRQYCQLSGSTAFLAMGVAGLVSSVFLFSRLRFNAKRFSGDFRLRDVARDHWSYGRWALATAAIAWFPDNIYYAILPGRAGLAGTAGLRALVNLFNPVLHTQVALSAVLIPLLVRRKQGLGIPGMVKTLRTLLALVIPASVGYLAVLWSLRPWLFKLLYNGKYREYAGWPFLLVGLIPVLTGATLVLGSALRAIEHPKLIFWGYATAGASALIVGLPLVRMFGVIGAAVGLLISTSTATLALAWLLRRQTQQASP